MDSRCLYLRLAHDFQVRKCYLKLSIINQDGLQLEIDSRIAFAQKKGSCLIC